MLTEVFKFISTGLLKQMTIVHFSRALILVVICLSKEIDSFGDQKINVKNLFCYSIFLPKEVVIVRMTYELSVRDSSSSAI